MEPYFWIGIYAFVNGLFVAKYAAPTAGPGAWTALAGGLAALVAIVAAFESRRMTARLTASRRTGRLLVLGGVLLLTAALCVVDVSHLAVARDRARAAWLGRLLSGEFPYGAEARPSGLPLLFLMALPFHRIGAPGLLQVAAFALFGGVLLAPRRDPGRGGDAEAHTARADGAPPLIDRIDLRPLLLLLLSPLLLYEVVVRSDLFANMVLLVLYVRWLDRALRRPSAGRDSRRRGRVRLLGAGILGGLVVATRLIVLLPLLLLSGRVRRRGFPDLLLFPAGLVLGFSAAVLPFLAWDPARFLREGPLAIQGAYVTPEYVAPLVLVALVEGMRVRTREQVWASSALLLFVAILLPFLHTVALTGLAGALYGDRFDISWFAFPLPFLILALREAAAHRTMPHRPWRGHPREPTP